MFGLGEIDCWFWFEFDLQRRCIAGAAVVGFIPDPVF